MAMAPTPVEGARSAWRRIGLWFERWAEAIDFDVSEHHERRIAQLEVELAALHSKSSVPSDRASSPQLTDKEAS